MYNLHNNSILTPYQVQILTAFFATDFSRPFFLTGGTALSAFYLAHRESKDLDLFSLEPFDTQQLAVIVQNIAAQTNSVVTTKVSSTTYHEIYLENKSAHWVQRLDFVQEQPKRFGTPKNIDGITVDSLENIGSNKVLTIFGRLEPKDYLDLYCIVTQTKFSFEKLYELAKQKDLGLSEFYFANIIAEVTNIRNWPPIKTPLDIKALVSFYQDLSRTLLLKIKPKTTLASLK